MNRSHGLSNRSSRKTAADPAAGIVPLRPRPSPGQAETPVRPPSAWQVQYVDPARSPAAESTARAPSPGSRTGLTLLILASTALVIAALLVRNPWERQPARPPVVAFDSWAGANVKPADTNAVPERSVPRASDAVSASGYIWPTAGTITQEFGCTDFELEPWNAALGCRFHYGIDIANATGTPILAAIAGRVVEAGWADDGYGYRVVLRASNGTSELYGHLCCAPDVVVGQRVEQGEQIGLMGTTGASSGPHLHFAIAVDGANVDPRDDLPNRMPQP